MQMSTKLHTVYASALKLERKGRLPRRAEPRRRRRRGGGGFAPGASRAGDGLLDRPGRVRRGRAGASRGGGRGARAGAVRLGRVRPSVRAAGGGRHARARRAGARAHAPLARRRRRGRVRRRDAGQALRERGCPREGAVGAPRAERRAVSYTHLTLPTKA